MKQLAVSFIIPVLNAERHVQRCLESIRNVNYPRERYEVLVIDNGSTDGTQQIVRDFGFDMVVVSNVTVGALRNKGGALARGDYLAFVDADVELMPQWLHVGLAAFEDPSVVAAGCFPKVPQPATWVQHAWDMHQRGKQLDAVPTAWLPSMNLLVRRDSFRKINGFNERLETAEDVDLCYRLGQHGTILCLPEMEAVHWGEARDLKSFWRKEVWRGMGNLKGVLAHGLRRDELPSIGYPLYVLCWTLLLVFSCSFYLARGRFVLAALSVTVVAVPAAALAVHTSLRCRRLSSLPPLFLLYLLYGLARGYSMLKASLCWLRYGVRFRARKCT